MPILNLFGEKNDLFVAIGEVLHYLESESLIHLYTYRILYRIAFFIMATQNGNLPTNKKSVTKRKVLTLGSVLYTSVGFSIC